MKRQSILLLIAAAFAFSFLPACSNETQESDAMQKPMEQPETDQAGIAAVNVEEAKALDIQHLKDAFKGETTASAKYAAYANKAEEEGYHEIAMLFKAASTSENIHANNHKAVLQEAGAEAPAVTPEFEVKTTAENLKDAIAGESYEITTMYPEFLKTANDAGAQLSLISLNYAYKTEQKHKVFYEKALAALEGNNVKSLTTVYYVCPTCGNTYETTSPKRCGISMTGADRFLKITSVGS